MYLCLHIYIYIIDYSFVWVGGIGPTVYMYMFTVGCVAIYVWSGYLQLI